MSRFRGRARIDKNQPEIVKMLRQAGVSVQPLSEIGHGCPDLLCGYQGKNYVFEVKDKDAPLTDAEMDWMGGWRGDARTIRSIDDALALMGYEQSGLQRRRTATGGK